MVKNSCVVTLLVAFLTQDSCKQRVNSLPISNKPSSVLSFITPSSSKLYASMSYVTIHIYYNNMLKKIYIYIVGFTIIGVLGWRVDSVPTWYLYPSLVSEGFWATVQVFPNKIRGFRYWLLSPSILQVEQCPESS